ncbi:hypothetical protein A6E13_16465 [Aliivibrio fischeri]|uniref:hypothetical protein n=1 Tax=Aliivibrio fischeri TaxID=668 RepID=UPI00080ED367|nr:hypothetical protein [Aliivibrio fischeri]OCH31815.1 hypothetical protein A6E13_16465 [Aliivibrio fischeri]
MLIMVIQGMDCCERNKVHTQLTHLKQPQVVTIDVGFVPDPLYRVERLKMLLHRSPLVLNVVIGANSMEEIDYLRGQHALFCNLHRHFPSGLLNIKGAISKEDVLISPSGLSESDVEVLSPDEAFSECFLRNKYRQRVA